ncbi:clostripain-related cysteine peptidase [Polyangium sp. y55x31]|uniref:clostripain-related cysteine peptidase n=1 Tax=Polyangium sp. y55x31 TaxID=3042688 RepID=UPI002483033C|nr:clostripain-related cysteine peptidase [Polyangium sp. y55x31]MDI1475956.1 clostripain-related cysteine peptidase [Polyangium sp. y55x31]
MGGKHVIALGALAAGLVACAPEGPSAGVVETTPAVEQSSAELRRGPPSLWTAEWTWLVFAANDDHDQNLVAAFDQDALEWQHGLGGSALFRILVQRDYAPFQVGDDGKPRPSERYSIYREEIRPPGRENEAPGVMVLGETDTSDMATLRDFLVEGVRMYPARHYWVTFTGHGDGFTGLADDTTSGEGKRLSLEGLSAALGEASKVIETEIRTRPGMSGLGTSNRIDVVAFDTCRMGAVEVASSLSGVADYLIASRETVPDAGHPYSALRYIAQDRPAASPRTLVEAVVTDYVRAYVEGVSTAGRAYVGTSITSVGLDLRRIKKLEEALAELVTAVRRERPRGFTCADVMSIFADACGGAGIVASAASAPHGGRSRRATRSRTTASDASVDLVALLERLADPSFCGPGGGGSVVVGPDLAAAAREVLTIIGRPHLWTREEPWGEQLQYGGQYRRLSGFHALSPFVVEAQRVEPKTGARHGGLSVLWGNPFELLLRENGRSLMDTYRATAFEKRTGWTKVLQACIDQAEACRTGVPDPHAPAGKDPCEGL